jgi:hypothetical protein
MRFDFTGECTVTATLDVDPVEFRGLDHDEIQEALEQMLSEEDGPQVQWDRMDLRIAASDIGAELDELVRRD